MFEIQEKTQNVWSNYFWNDPGFTIDTKREAEDTLKLIKQYRGNLNLRIVETEPHTYEF